MANPPTTPRKSEEEHFLETLESWRNTAAGLDDGDVLPRDENDLLWWEDASNEDDFLWWSGAIIEMLPQHAPTLSPQPIIDLCGLVSLHKPIPRNAITAAMFTVKSLEGAIVERRREQWLKRIAQENRGRIFPRGIPKDADIVDLAVRLDSERAKPAAEHRSDRVVARDFTSGNTTKAESLLRTIRRMKARGEITL